MVAIPKSTDPETLRWIQSTGDRAAVRDGCRFDLAAAERVRNFGRQFIRHSKGEWAGKPFELLDWQWRHIIGPMFGWKRPDGTRRFRRCYCEIPKKNGKSTLCSLLALYLLLADNEPGSEVYAIASDRKQAGIVFGESANMVEASPALMRELTVVRSTQHILHAASRSLYRVLSKSVDAAHGQNIHGLIFDELHAQKTRELWDAILYGGAARRQPLLAAITTAGYDKHSVCYEQHLYAKGVWEWLIEDWSFLPFIAAAGADDDWTKEETWKKANPSYGHTLKADQFAADCREAQEQPAKENNFRRLRLNQWTEQDVRAIPMQKWDAITTPVDPAALAGRKCYAGLDLASTTDIAALVLVFPETAETPELDPETSEPTGETTTSIVGYDLLPFFYVPADGALQRSRTDHVPYDAWIRDGHIIATPGGSIDYDRIRKHINELGKTYEIAGIAADRWNATQIINQLTGDGFEICAFGQGYASMTAPTKELLRLVVDGKLRHGNHPVLRWMAANLSTESDAAENLKPSKKTSTEKIDGIVSTIMGIGVAMVNGGSDGWFYENNDLESG